MTIRLFAGDPGKQKSSFGGLLSDVYTNEIRILGAKQWKNLNYTVVEDDIARMHATPGVGPFNRYIVERNNTGQHVVDSFKRYHPQVPIWPVDTVGMPVKDRDKIQMGQTMYKTGTAEYTKRLKDKGALKFPKVSTPEIEELKRQMEEFLPHVQAGTGHISYHTEGVRKDDLVMCLLLTCYVASYYLEQDLTPIVLSANDGEDFWASIKSPAQKTYDEKLAGKIRGLKSPGMEITDITVDGEHVQYER